jgi:hypothetical protein
MERVTRESVQSSTVRQKTFALGRSVCILWNVEVSLPDLTKIIHTAG